jgi:ATP-dependent DNA helicase RecG
MDLNSPVDLLPLVGPAYARRLEKLEISSLKDLLYHVPHRYLDFTQGSPLSLVQPGETVAVSGEVDSIKNQYTRRGRQIQIAHIHDGSGKISVVWFSQPYLVKILYPGVRVSLAGKVGWFVNKKALVSPEYEVVKKGKDKIHTSGLIPIYPETAGLSSKWLRARIRESLKTAKITEYLPDSLLKSEGLMPLKEALNSVHSPKALGAAQKARDRLAFDELFFLQLASLKRKKLWQKNKTAHKLIVEKTELQAFIDSLPFSLTKSQNLVLSQILSDLGKEFPMNRLLEGDVGSGKTVVAAIAAFVSFLNGYQSVVMAPTQILANQHYETLKTLLDPFKVRVTLITGSVVKKDLGRSDIFVGTHSLINKKAIFENVAFMAIDEQQRFGVKQREELVKKGKSTGKSAHLLTLTATPIPRTVALTFYGDLDLSVLSELPPGRQQINTWVVPPVKRPKALSWVEAEISKNKSQAFIICPLIEESDKETMQSVKAVTQEYKDLKKLFPILKLGLMHGRLKAQEKEKVMSGFKEGKIDILVATPVVEVGIDVANATLMLIEGAERFGLAQLHQLRGRVGRGEKKSYCLLFSDSASLKVLSRLHAMEKGISGFELAELDLKLRGPGEIFGTRQHGFPELKIASWQEVSLIGRAKRAAESFKPKKGFVLARQAGMV